MATSLPREVTQPVTMMQGVKEGNIFGSGDEWMVDPLNLILHLGDVKGLQYLTSPEK